MLALAISLLTGLLNGHALTSPDDRPQAGAPKAKVSNPHGPIAVSCQNCHTSVSWKPIRAIPEFSHDQTGYPLRGMHEKVGCMQCHTNLVFRQVGSQCADCHADIHRRQMGADCARCHTVRGWNVSLQRINQHDNRFPLVGAHALVECEQCHRNAAAGQFVGLSTSCYSCHQRDFRTPVIDHVSAGFPTTCESCHTVNSWFGAKFDHLKYTGFALTGMHATLSCSACHLNNVFQGTPADCFSCHRTDFVSAGNPSHTQLALPHDCGTCHTTTSWLNAKFDHALYAHYPLTGMHATLTCEQCHLNNNYSNTATACYACHKADFNGTKNPNHVSSGFPTDCSLCHTTSGWSPASFNHNSVGFPLTGAHATLPCAQCHTNNNYATLPKDCYSCHKVDYTGTNNPPHAAAGFPTTCETCHNTTSWLNATFNHNSTPFPLTGAHVNVPCTSCHVNNVFVGTPTACYSCHKADYASATNPNHASAGFPTDCTICHSTSGWSPSSFNHAAVYPLTGAHATLQCALCHVNGNFTTVATDCYSCHKQDYAGTTNPNHTSAGFPTACATCHNTSTWSGAVFNHNSTPFPLTGAHVNVPCTSCHINNTFAGTPTDCYSCHKADYAGTTNPNHTTAGFPTTCATCHTTSAWTGATFNHTWFPTNHGGAGGVCATCHTNSNDYSVFTCTNCHTKTTMDSRHRGIQGYQYLSTSCYTCHKNGRS